MDLERTKNVRQYCFCYCNLVGGPGIKLSVILSRRCFLLSSFIGMVAAVYLLHRLLQAQLDKVYHPKTNWTTSTMLYTQGRETQHKLITDEQLVKIQFPSYTWTLHLPVWWHMAEIMVLRKNDTILSFESWRNNLTHCLSLEHNYAPFLEATQEKMSCTHSNCGFTSDSAETFKDLPGIGLYLKNWAMKWLSIARLLLLPWW